MPFFTYKKEKVTKAIGNWTSEGDFDDLEYKPVGIVNGESVLVKVWIKKIIMNNLTLSECLWTDLSGAFSSIMPLKNTRPQFNTAIHV